MCQIPPRRLPFLAFTSILLFLAAPVPGQTSPTIAIDVTDVAGRPLATGTLTLCPQDTSCQVYAIGDQARVRVHRDHLFEDALTILVHDTTGHPPLAASEWSISPPDRRLLSRIPHRVAGRLQITPSGGLTLTFAPDTRVWPVAQEPPSRWVLAAGATWLLGGRFGSDGQAIGGGVEATVGPVLMLGRRLGIPGRWPEGRASLDFVEITLAYAMNRYTVGPLDDGVGRDLAFHRVQLAVGLGRAWRHTRLVLQGVVGYGGVYDGTTVLERAGRRYAMPAFGGTIRGSRHLATVARLRLGLFGQFSIVHHGADPTVQDHWYGFAPSIRVGLVTD